MKLRHLSKNKKIGDLGESAYLTKKNDVINQISGQRYMRKPSISRNSSFLHKNQSNKNGRKTVRGNLLNFSSVENSGIINNKNTTQTRNLNLKNKKLGSKKNIFLSKYSKYFKKKKSQPMKNFSSLRFNFPLKKSRPSSRMKNQESKRKRCSSFDHSSFVIHILNLERNISKI